jgi:hypothetical protein
MGVRVRTSLTFHGFEGDYQNSEKLPDLAVKFNNSTGFCQAMLVAEVGFSEIYNDLVRDVHLWLNGNPNVAVAILVKINESPKYRGPIRQGLELLGLQGEGKNPEFNILGEFGPVLHKGQVWVGDLSKSFMEVRKRDPRIGVATSVGDRVVSHYLAQSVHHAHFYSAESPCTGQPANVGFSTK